MVTPDPVKSLLEQDKAKYGSTARSYTVFDRAESSRVAGFDDSSQYDRGKLVYGIDQYRVRARNQPWYDQVANAVPRTIAGAAIGLVEDVGLLGELASGDKDYRNSLTDFSESARSNLEKVFPIYRLNPDKTLDPRDSGWWIENGQSLAESVAEFLILGTGVGSLANKGARALGKAIGSQVLKSGVADGSAAAIEKALSVAGGVEKGINATAHIGTAGLLAYTEEGKDAISVYNTTYQKQLSLGVSEEAARATAAEAASTVMRIGVPITLALNLTSLGPVFKSTNGIKSSVRDAIRPKIGETIEQFSDRLAKIGIPKGSSLGKAVIREMVQEGTEESFQLYAQNEGSRKGGVISSIQSSASDRLVEDVFSEQGALSFALGSIGGGFQHLGMEVIPYRQSKDEKTGKTRLVNSRTLEKETTEREFKSSITDLQADINRVITAKKNLTQAVLSNDNTKIEKAKNELFGTLAFKSIKNGLGEVFAQELEGVALDDNTQVGEDGKTEAMRKGYAENTEDNSYKEIAVQRAEDIRSLEREYQALEERYSPLAAEYIFPTRVQLYAQQASLENLTKRSDELEVQLSSLATSVPALGLSKLVASQAAYNILISQLQGRAKEIAEEKKKLIDEQIKTERELLGYSQADKSVKANSGVITNLMLAYVPKLATEAEVETKKEEYNDLISKSSKDLETAAKELIKKQNKANEEVVKARQTEDNKNKQEKEVADKSEAKKATKLTGTPNNDQEAKETSSEYKGYTIKETKGLTNGFTVYSPTGSEMNRFNTVEAARNFIDTNQPTVGTQQLQNNISEGDTNFYGKDKDSKKDEEENLTNTVEENNPEDNPTLGKNNKVAYKAQEQDSEGKTVNLNQINEEYWINHDPTKIVKDTPITLKVAIEYSSYETNKDNIGKVPIGVYYNNTIIGYIPITDSEKGPLLDIRREVIRKGTVTTKVEYKSIGNLNKGNKISVRDAMPDVVRFAIGRNNDLEINLKQSIASQVLNKKGFQSGFVYAIVPTPNGESIAIPIDIKKVTKEIADSVSTTIRVFIKQNNLSEQQNKIVKEIFDLYDIDITTINGLRKYVGSFLYTNENLDRIEEIVRINDEVGKDKHYIKVTETGVAFIKSGAAYKTKDGKLIAQELGINTPENQVDGLLNILQKHITNMYSRVDLTKIQANAEFRLPLLSFDKDSNLIYNEYYRATYSDYIKEHTETNVSGIHIGNNNYTYFTQPSIYIDYSFMGETESSQKIRENEKKPEDIAKLATKPKLSSLTISLPDTILDITNTLTDDDIDERINHCL